MRFIHEHRDQFAVALLLRVLNIGASTYYAWVKQAEQPCDRDVVDLGLISNIHEIWETSGRTYGADRVHRQLRRDGIRVGRKRVERLMAAHGWQGAFLRRGWRGGSTKQDPRHTPAPDLVNRQFTADGPNRLWVADATRIPCGEGVFWLAAVRDVFSRRIVGWKTSDRCDTDLILAALEYGIWSRDVRERPVDPPQRPRLELHVVPLLRTLTGQRNPALHGLRRRLVRQRADGELLVNVEDRTRLPHVLADPRRGRERDLRLHRRLVQHPPHPTRAGLPQPERVRDRLAQPPYRASQTTYRHPCASRQQV
ncbi:LOW QUALITY PROTEIN: transposase, partial [Micromonospora sp. M42]